MIRHAAVLAIALCACAPRAHSPTFQAAPDAAQQEKPHTKISKGGATGLAVLGAVIVGFAGAAIFLIPRTGNAS
jgi:hypothetical protein